MKKPLTNEEIKMKCWNDIDRALALKNQQFQEAVEELKSKRNNGDFIHLRYVEKIFGSISDTENQSPQKIVKEVLDKILHSECLNCEKNIDVSFKNSYRWKLPICKKCRIIFLEEI